MKLIYVAGPFTAADRSGVQRNIAAAEAIGIEVARLGALPVVPHANTSHPNYEAVQPYEFWIGATMELLRRCDALLTVPGWETSKGASGEVDEAARLCMPSFRSLVDLDHWLRAERDQRDTEPSPMPDAEFLARLGVPE